MINENPLILFVGRSASGKTTIANMLEENHDFKQVQSYTTRPPRFEGEPGHIFVSKEDFPKEEDIVAYTMYNGYEYCATLEQVQEADIYVVDVDGVETILENKDRIGRDIHIIYFDCNVAVRIGRMLERGSTDRQIIERLRFDESFDWVPALRELTRKFDLPGMWHIWHIHYIEAYNSLDAVYLQVIGKINMIYDYANYGIAD